MQGRRWMQICTCYSRNENSGPQPYTAEIIQPGQQEQDSSEVACTWPLPRALSRTQRVTESGGQTLVTANTFPITESGGHALVAAWALSGQRFSGTFDIEKPWRTQMVSEEEQ